MTRVVSFTGPRVAEVVAEAAKPLTAGDVRLRTLFSGISAGTELTGYRGTNPYLAKRWDNDLRLFVDGAVSREYPLTGWGYEEVGEVVEIGDAVDGVSVGDRIWGTWGHRSETVVTAEYARARILDSDVDPRVGMFSQIGGIALNVVLDADIHVGETVAVFGLGVPGQLVAQLARLNGGRVIAVDGVASRRDLALKLGAAEALDPAAGGVAEEIRVRTDGRGADVCLEVTGNYGALHEAIRAVAYSSRVCAAGFMQGDGLGLRLGEEFHHNRVQVVSTQISGVAPAVQHRWDRFRLDSTAIALATSGALRVTDLISHTFPLDRAADAFTLLDGATQDVLQVVLQA
ncbi:zinc-binding dehydrogenase [Asanoa iriomotensis]|uniref:Oxidoreductase n=1 Tax=Asanoa iriomotensis TaxID=234613 RepID=A0ABQ4C8M5_9ACTN|nr:zinc-binding dehydrogenase [Asanoa iriomotensis]GIF58675.1 oxidoreductase [Asanoa iriomotensis]